MWDVIYIVVRINIAIILNIGLSKVISKANLIYWILKNPEIIKKETVTTGSRKIYI